MDQCVTCEVYFYSDQERVSHMASRRHKKNIARKGALNRTLFVVGFPRDTPEIELVSIFSRCGEVRSVQINQAKKTFAFVEFATEETAKKALQLTHYFNGKKLQVHRKGRIQNMKAECTVSHQAIVSALQKCSSVAEQIRTFCSLVRMETEDIEERKAVRCLIESILLPYFPDCRVHVYGSTVNGFGVKGCDLDLLFETSPRYSSVEGPPLDIPEVPSVSDVEVGSFSLEDLRRMPKRMQIQFIAEVLKKHPEFLKPHFIPAQCPIVHFVCKKQRQQCDISCSNQLVLHNSSLLWLYGKLDQRVVPMMMLLRYWAKYRGIIQTGAISSYAFSMLVIFFLQSTSPPVLPTVEYLKSVSDQSVVEDGYECGICLDVTRIRASENTQALEYLLVHFFHFYMEFDFSYVVSPLTGEAEHRNDFEYSGHKDKHDFETSPICIQDPFETRRNVAAFQDARCLMALKSAMAAAAKVYTHECFDPSLNIHWGILSLFATLMVDSLFQIPVENVVPVKGACSEFTFAFSRRLQDVLVRSPAAVCQKIVLSVMSVFKYVLLCETELIDQVEVVCSFNDSSDSDGVFVLPSMDTYGRWKLTKSSAGLFPSRGDVKCKPVLLMSAQNTVFHDVWHGRIKARKNCLAAADLTKAIRSMEVERSVSMSLMPSQDAKDFVPVSFTCDCYLYRRMSQDKLHFVVTCNSAFHYFTELVRCLKEVLRTVLKEELELR